MDGNKVTNRPATSRPAATGLPPGQQLAAPGKWPMVGERCPAAWGEPWSVELGGLVSRPMQLSIDDLFRLPLVEANIDIHCVTRWSKLGVRFGGVLLQTLLEQCGPLAPRVDDGLSRSERPTFVSFVARSTRDHSTSLVLAEALQLGTLIALTCNGQPLPMEHGGPVRAIVPGRYFYKSLKWLAKIELLAKDRLGYWEATAGYHNHADPWQEERYLAPAISRQDAAAVIAARDFSGRDLRSIDCRHRDLTGLQARGALLRDADFREAILAGADFAQANLSNARLQRADLRNALFREADVEGADFCGADLRGAYFRGASLLGTTFVDATIGLEAQLDTTTQFDAERLDELTPQQAAFVRSRLANC